MTIRVNFDIAMPNKPYVDDFSDGNTHPAVYTGFRWIKFQYNAETKEIATVIAEADTVDDLPMNETAVAEGYQSATLNCEENPLIASIITRNYETGEVADYSEDLGTTDAEGNAETWTYYWNDNTGVLGQIYLNNTMKYVDNNFVMPTFRSHALSREAFLEGVTNQIAGCDNELARADVYNEEETAKINAHKAWLQAVPTKYANVDHWKIPFPASPEFK